MKIGLIVTFVGTLAASGCSTITQSENQTLAVTTTYQGKPVSADCTMVNDKGTWSGKAPGNVSVHKSGENLSVTCKAADTPDGLLTAISRAAGSMFGNIIFGGGIGALIDHSKGTGYDYPDVLSVKMGEAVVVDRKEQQQKEKAAKEQATGTATGAIASSCAGQASC